MKNMVETELMENINAVVVKVNKENYLLDVTNVKEIYIPGKRIIPIPLSDKEVVGIIEIRKEIYTVLSLKHKINPKEEDYGISSKSRILLLNYDGLNIGLLVDSVIGVKEFAANLFTSENAIIETEMDWKHIRSVGIIDNNTYILLNLQSILPPSKLSSSSSISDKQKVQLSLKPQRSRPSSSAARAPLSNQTISKIDDQLTITSVQMDALMEIGNIGTGNAVTALSEMIKKRIDLEFTEVKIVTYEKLLEEFGPDNNMVCGIFSHIEKPSQSTLLQIFDMEPLIEIVSSMVKTKTKIRASKVKSKEDLDDLTASTIIEVGNILAGHYTSALANLMEIKLVPEVPDLTMSSVESLSDFLSNELRKISKYLVLIKTRINVVDEKINGFFLFIPDIDSLGLLFSKLGIEYRDILKPIDLEKEKLFDLKKTELTERQKDALREVGNIGAGNAANALAEMLNERVDINIPSVQIIAIEKYAERLGSKTEKLFLSWSNVVGITKATVLVIFRVPDIINLVSIIANSKEKIDVKKIKTMGDFPEIFSSAMSEVGHILSSHYTSAIGNLLGIKLMPEPPDTNIDTGKHLFHILKDEIDVFEELSLLITTNVIIKEQEIEGTFLFIPDLSTLQELLEALEGFY
jgi:chemotaxis protein CheC